MTLRLAPLLALLCLPFAALAQSSERTAYTCDNDSRIEIAFSTAADGRPLAVLHFADEAITLPQVPAASGALYRNEIILLHLRDDTAVVEDSKGNRRRCSRGDLAPARPAASSAPAAVSSFIDIAGQVTYRQRSALPPNAVLIIRVQDGKRTLAEQRIELAGQQVPIGFQTSIDRDLLGKKSRVSVTARIEQAGRLLFANARPHPAPLTEQPLDIQLQPVTHARPR